MRIALALGLLLASSLTPSRGAAQSCHGSRDLPLDGEGLGVRVASSVGAYDTAGVSGQYGGLQVGVWGRSRFVEGEASLGGYFLADMGQGWWGLGDTIIAARARLFADPEPLELALGARLSVPTARTNAGLGMGHFMAGPELRAGHRWRRVGVSTSVAYMRALSAADAHAHHHDPGPTPRVDPHGMSELASALSVTVRFAEAWVARAAGVLSLPIDDALGTSRFVVGPGLTWTLGRASLSADLEVPLLGSPFLIRATLSLDVLLR